MLLWFVLATMMTNPGSGQEPAGSPAGLWQSEEEGFVMRIEPCGTALCGFTVGLSATKKTKKPMQCGKQMLKDYQWNEKKSRWEGRMLAPDSTREADSSITSDGKTFLRLRGQVMFMSMTMSFVPYVGELREGCRIDEPPAKPSGHSPVQSQPGSVRIENARASTSPVTVIRWPSEPDATSLLLGIGR